MHDLIDISQVDFTKIDQIRGFGALILSDANRLGLDGDTPSRQSKEAIRTSETARRWINGVQYVLPRLSPADAFSLVDIYDFIHQIAHRRPADPAFIDSLILRALEALAHGDKTIDQYRLYHAIDLRVRRKSRAFLGLPLQWLAASLHRWHRNFKTGKWREMSAYDIIRQSAILIGADLTLYESDGNRFKKTLFENCRHWLDETEGMTLLELEALSQFLTSSIKFLSQEEYCRHDETILTAIIAHPATDPHYRRSLELNLSLICP